MLLTTGIMKRKVPSTYCLGPFWRRGCRPRRTVSCPLSCCACELPTRANGPVNVLYHRLALSRLLDLTVNCLLFYCTSSIARASKCAHGGVISKLRGKSRPHRQWLVPCLVVHESDPCQRTGRWMCHITGSFCRSCLLSQRIVPYSVVHEGCPCGQMGWSLRAVAALIHKGTRSDMGYWAGTRAIWRDCRAIAPRTVKPINVALEVVPGGHACLSPTVSKLKDAIVGIRSSGSSTARAVMP